MSAITCRTMRAEEASAASALAIRVFDQFVASDFVTEGVEEFHRYAGPDRLAERSETDHLVFVAVDEDDLVGMAELRPPSHLAMLFVNRPGRGVGSALLETVRAACRRIDPAADRLTVNSAPSAVSFYTRLGFVPTDAEQEKNGIRFVPMTMDLAPRVGD